MNSRYFRLRHIFQAMIMIVAGLTVASAESLLNGERALAISQDAIGRQVADMRFLDEEGRGVRLSDFTDKPVLVSLIYTSCHHTCPMITQYLKNQVDHARERLGKDSFHVLTIGFDAQHDSPQAMSAFRRAQGVSHSNWDFLSADQSTTRQLTDQLGFHFVQSPRGFDHLVQLSILDRERRVTAQVYGARFESPWLMEPLKRLVYGEPAQSDGFLSGLVNRVKLFCTIYNPNTGQYTFDYSLFIQMTIGAIIILAGFLYLLRERRRGRQC